MTPMKPQSESGVALLSAILALMFMSAMVIGFMSMVDADQRSSMINRDQTQAYAAAHAGVEKLTADLGQLFTQVTYSPTGAQVNALTTTAMTPSIPGTTYTRPEGGSGYRVTFTDLTGPNGVGGPDGNPDVVGPLDGRLITSGPFEGLKGLMTPYTLQVTAQATGNSEVRMERELQTVAVPVFQFGMFSENSLSFFAGPDFSFGGRVHTNQHLFLKQDGNATLTLQDRVSAVGEIIRTHLSNGVSSHFGTVRMALAPGCPAAPTAANGACRDLEEDEGSQIGALGSADNPGWLDVSTDDYGGWITNGDTGARRLDLQIARDGAQPIDLIRVPPAGEATNSPIGRQRYYNMASVRILLADTSADLTGHPGAVGNPVALSGWYAAPQGLTAVPQGIDAAGFHPFAWSGGLPTVLPLIDSGYRTDIISLVPLQTPSTIGGFILINKQNKNGVWADVTRDVLSLGFTGRRLSTGVLDSPDTDNMCPEYHPNAVIRVQRVADDAPNVASCGPLVPTVAPSLLSTGLAFWPNVLYDPREGMLRDNEAGRPAAPGGRQRLYFGGVMHYVELDVNNLRRWLYGLIGNANTGCPSGNTTVTCPMDVTGYVAYFSDRRTNRNLANQETGEFGWEDNINNNAAGTPNDQLDGAFVDTANVTRWAEDVNQSGAPVETYGNIARSGGSPMMALATMALYPNATAVPPVTNYSLWQNPIDRNVARVNQAFFFRRALKLTHGGRDNLPRNGNQGLTVAAENPVYVEGNYNACNNNSPNEVGGVVPRFGNQYGTQCVGGVGFGNTPGVDHVSASVIADAVTFLSNAWNDIKSFRNPHAVDATDLTNAFPAEYPGETNAPASPSAREAVDTWYRLGIISGKGLGFPRAGYAGGNDHTDFGTDGGAHNFIRYIENWGGAELRYRGSLISFYTSRQATGTYKCCDIVYSPPERHYAFDTDFSNPSLLPPQTPMFRDLNTLKFRQLLRPTQ